MTAKPTQKDEVLRLLKKHRRLTNVQFRQHGIFVYAQRVYDLNQEGWDIESHHIKGSLWVFTFNGRKEAA